MVKNIVKGFQSSPNKRGNIPLISVLEKSGRQKYEEWERRNDKIFDVVRTVTLVGLGVILGWVLFG